MATKRCIKAVEKMVENGGIVSKAMRDAGYSPETAKSPSKLTESKGYKEVCEMYGLTDSLIITALVEDIKLKPQNRKPELELGAKMTGLLIDRKELTGKDGKDLINQENKQKADEALKDFIGISN
jgi:hypothetical protein